MSGLGPVGPMEVKGGSSPPGAGSSAPGPPTPGPPTPGPPTPGAEPGTTVNSGAAAEAGGGEGPGVGGQAGGREGCGAGLAIVQNNWVGGGEAEHGGARGTEEVNKDSLMSQGEPDSSTTASKSETDGSEKRGQAGGEAQGTKSGHEGWSVEELKKIFRAVDTVSVRVGVGVR